MTLNGYQLSVLADRALGAVPLAPKLIPLIRCHSCPDPYVSIQESRI